MYTHSQVNLHTHVGQPDARPPAARSFLATSGLFGIMIAMHKCAQIDIYGFQVHSRHGVVGAALACPRMMPRAPPYAWKHSSSGNFDRVPTRSTRMGRRSAG